MFLVFPRLTVNGLYPSRLLRFLGTVGLQLLPWYRRPPLAQKQEAATQGALAKARAFARSLWLREARAFARGCLHTAGSKRSKRGKVKKNY
jgi:hypothetical protein